MALSNWNHDTYTLGGYTFMQVGSSVDMVESLQEIEVSEGKLWFIGEHTNPEVLSYANGAY